MSNQQIHPGMQLVPANFESLKGSREPGQMRGHLGEYVQRLKILKQEAGVNLVDLSRRTGYGTQYLGLLFSSRLRTGEVNVVWLDRLQLELTKALSEKTPGGVTRQEV